MDTLGTFPKFDISCMKKAEMELKYVDIYATTDLWSSRTEKAYVHFVDSDL